MEYGITALLFQDLSNRTVDFNSIRDAIFNANDNLLVEILERDYSHPDAAQFDVVDVPCLIIIYTPDILKNNGYILSQLKGSEITSTKVNSLRSFLNGFEPNNSVLGQLINQQGQFIGKGGDIILANDVGTFDLINNEGAGGFGFLGDGAGLGLGIPRFVWLIVAGAAGLQFNKSTSTVGKAGFGGVAAYSLFKYFKN